MARNYRRADGAERDWQRLTQEFHNESDRATALVAAALLDENLESLLRSFLVNDDREVEIILGSNLQSLGGRIRACYCLGLISHDEMHDLRTLKEIRNYFAHNLHVSFDDDWVQKRCTEMVLIRRMMQDVEEIAHRLAVEQTTCMLSTLLVQRERHFRGRRRSIRPEMTQLEMSEQCMLNHPQDQGRSRD
jgi:DNA-binding MltR family transcriptional regulator